LGIELSPFVKDVAILRRLRPGEVRNRPFCQRKVMVCQNALALLSQVIGK